MISWFRHGGTLITYIGLTLALDPKGLIRKVGQKAGSDINLGNLFTDAEVAEDAGNLQLALQLARRWSWSPSVLRRNLQCKWRIRRRLTWASYPIIVSARSFPQLPPKVLFVLNNSLPFTNSGYTKRSEAVLKTLAENGLPVSAQTRFGYPSIVGVLNIAKGSTHQAVDYSRNLGFRYPARASKEVQMAVRGVVSQALKDRATVLHTTTPFNNAIVVSRAAAQLQIPWVYEMRGEEEKTWLATPSDTGTDRSEQSELYQICRDRETDAAKSAHKVVVLSEVARNDLIARGVDPAKIIIAPNGTDVDPLEAVPTQSEARLSTGIGDGFIVGTVTAVVRYEGIETAIRALKHLPEDVLLLVVGSGPDLQRLRRLAESLNLSHRVMFPGSVPQNESLKWYRSLDVFLVPRDDLEVCRSVTPVKPLNAMALGIPIIASDLPALREVTGGRANYFNAGSHHDLARSINRVRLDGCETQGAKEWSLNRSWEHTMSELLKVYTQPEERLDREL